MIEEQPGGERRVTMAHADLKQALRLNRTIALSLLLYGVFLAGALVLLARGGGDAMAVVWTDWGVTSRLGGLLALGLGFFVLNEAVLKSVKRHARLDEMTLDKLGLLTSLCSVMVVLLGYVLSGQVGVLLLSVAVMLQVYLLGHGGLARLILPLMGLAYLGTIPLGYPLLFGFSAIGPKTLPWAMQWVLVLGPLAWTLSHLGGVMSSLLRSTSSRVSRLQSLAATDALTGLINRRQFNYQLDSEIARARRYRKPLSLALFDIDDFKKINDFYGHPTGDRILKELGQLIIQNVRESDIPARYGGEEFALILPETAQMDAYEILERLRALVAHTVFCLPDNPMTVTVSVGVAQLDMDHPQSYELIERADAALYEAKKQGKNQVVYGVVPAPKISYPPFTPR